MSERAPWEQTTQAAQHVQALRAPVQAGGAQRQSTSSMTWAGHGVANPAQPTPPSPIVRAQPRCLGLTRPGRAQEVEAQHHQDGGVPKLAVRAAAEQVADRVLACGGGGEELGCEPMGSEVWEGRQRPPAAAGALAGVQLAGRTCGLRGPPAARGLGSSPGTLISVASSL